MKITNKIGFPQYYSVIMNLSKDHDKEFTPIDIEVNVFSNLEENLERVRESGDRNKFLFKHFYESQTRFGEEITPGQELAF